MSKITIKIFKSVSGTCQKCGTQSEEMYDVTLSQAGKEKTYKLCRNCAEIAKKSVDKKNAESSDTYSYAEQTNVQTANAPTEHSNSPQLSHITPTNTDSTDKKPEKRKARSHSAVLYVILALILIVAAFIVYSVVNALNQGPANSNDTSGENNNYYSDEHREESSLGTSETAPINKKGIVVVSCDNASSMTIYLVDPVTGKANIYSKFDLSGFNDLTAQEVFLFNAESLNNRAVFSKDYSKFATYMQDKETGNKYAGWYGADGKFTNIYEKLFGTPDMFSEKVNSEGLGFDDNGYYYFKVNNSIESKARMYEQYIGSDKYIHYYKVPVDEITTEKLTEFTDEISQNDYQLVALYLYLNFGNTDLYDTWCNELKKLQSNQITGWIGKSNCFWNYYDSTIIKQFADGTQTKMFSANSNLMCTNAVGSPDGSQIAFEAKLSTSSDKYFHLYVSGSDGQNPKEIKTDLSFYNIDYPLECTKVFDWI